jgi:hypothetical protein
MLVFLRRLIGKEEVMLKKITLLSIVGLALAGAPLAPASAAAEGTPECDAEATAYANSRANPDTNYAKWEDAYWFYYDFRCTAP